MDDNVHRDNGRHKPPQGQWLMQHQPSMKQIMAIMAERDAAIQERNLALSEKKTALAERDMAILQRDSAIAERNNAIIERDNAIDNAIATLQYRENPTNNGNMAQCPTGFQIAHDMKLMGHPQQHLHPQHHPGEASYGSAEMPMNDAISVSPVSSEPAKSRRTKRAKEGVPAKRTSKSTKKLKKEGEDLNNAMFGNSEDWKAGQEMTSGSDDRVLIKPDWKNQELGLNQVAFDDTTMPVPVCSCTGVFRSCYKWGNGGWQSSCCTTNLSLYPLPAVPNKRHARIGGRKMSGSAFNKLLSRLAAEGYDLSNPVDLKEHWAKHGTNRYITIK